MNKSRIKRIQDLAENLSELDYIKEGVLEIKTVQIYDHDWACGQMPEHYFAQVCQYLLVTGCEFAKVEGLKGRLQEVVYA